MPKAELTKKLKRFEEEINKIFRRRGMFLEPSDILAKGISSKALQLAKEAVGGNEAQSPHDKDMEFPNFIRNELRKEIHQKLSEIFGKEGEDERRT